MTFVCRNRATFRCEEFVCVLGVILSTVYCVFLFVFGAALAAIMSLLVITQFAFLAYSVHVRRREMSDAFTNVDGDNLENGANRDIELESVSQSPQLADNLDESGALESKSLSTRSFFLRALVAIALTILFTGVFFRTPMPLNVVMLFLSPTLPIVGILFATLEQESANRVIYNVWAVLLASAMVALIVFGTHIQSAVTTTLPVLDVACMASDKSAPANNFTVTYAHVDVNLPGNCGGLEWQTVAQPQQMQTPHTVGDQDLGRCQLWTEPHVFNRGTRRLVIEASTPHNATQSCCNECDQKRLPIFQLQIRCSPIEAWRWVSPVYLRNSEKQCKTKRDKGMLVHREWPFRSSTFLESGMWAIVTLHIGGLLYIHLKKAI